ncbi:MAG: hypothetical protein VX466_10120 [Myxococcota bacterium]|nr:hypothetical protein [Myxococcota bacterium]
MIRTAACLLLFGVAGIAGPLRAEPVIERTAERGPVIVILRIEPGEPVIGDSVTLDFEVRAEPNVELLMPEFGEALGRFQIVDFVPSEEIDDRGATIARQRYHLQPARSGRQTIPPLRVEFVDRRTGYQPAPEGEDAYELMTDRVVLEIGSVLPAQAPLELRDAHEPLAPRRGPLGPWWAWATGAGLLLAAAAPFLVRLYRNAQAQRRQASAYEIARSELDALLYGGRPAADRAAMDAFYVKLSTIVRRYLENRFALRSPEQTTEEFLSDMGRSPDLARTHQQLLRAFLEQADLVKFAALVPSGDDLDVQIQAAQAFLEETREQATASEVIGV